MKTENYEESIVIHITPAAAGVFIILKFYLARVKYPISPYLLGYNTKK
jgi:hypothetical protein